MAIERISRSSTYSSFICVNMSSKHNINFVAYKPRLKHDPHGLPFHVMIIVTVIPWGMYKNNQPWGFTPVYLG